MESVPSPASNINAVQLANSSNGTTNCNSSGSASSNSSSNNNNNSSNINNLLLAKEAQDLKIKTNKLQLEIEEKNEIINVLKDELETSRELGDKFQKENIQLVKDAKRVKFLQDENDYLQDKVGSVDKLELEIKRLKEKLNESEFFKIRIKELEEDLNKSQNESQEFENKWQAAESRLTRVPELEAELDKWKSFSNELEQEKNSIQAKLLESIDHETKLNSINKKVEDEVKRLRDLIKSYEEDRDEEQASNSLIMSVADLKQFDLAEQEKAEKQQPSLCVEMGTDPLNVDVQEQGQQTGTSDTADKSIGTDPQQPHPLELEELEAQKEQLARLEQLNEGLREDLKRQECRTDELRGDNERIRDELASNRKVVAELRQDLACEKSLAQKLNTQLASFTKQIKTLDKQYFPMHDASSKTATAKAVVSVATDSSKSSTESERLEHSTNKVVAPTKSDSSIRDQNETPRSQNYIIVAEQQQSDGKPAMPPATAPLRPAASGKPSAVDSTNKRCVVFDSKRQAASANSGLTTNNGSLAAATEATAATFKSAPSSSSSSKRAQDNEDEEEEDDDDESLEDDYKDKIDNLTELRQKKSKSFVRNSMPSRSANFGHSKSSGYLDRIRASVTATTTTTNSSASFNEQSTVKNIVIGSQQQVCLPQQARYVLNCMLDHQHSERCYVAAEPARPAHVQASQPAMLSSESIYGHHHHHLHHPHAHPQSHAHDHHLQSRQLNALIDPATHNHLLMGMLQDGATPAGGQLTEQQVAHLNNLHRQHYFHHLHQLHKMHHLHHVHHLKHQCAQQQQQQQQQPQQLHPEPVEQTYQQTPAATQMSGAVGSQFYAPGGRYDQTYSNVAIINNGVNQMKEQQQQQQQQQNGTRLVNKNNEQLRQQQQQHAMSPPQPPSRASPQRSSAGLVYYQMNKNLPQINEINGLPTVDDHAAPAQQATSKSHLQLKRLSPSRPADKTSQVNGTGAVVGNARQSVKSNNISPISLSSPTSSRTSSNISPSSESSSSSTSGTNSSLTAEPLTRSALRHTTTELGRRQFSVERELINSAPMTATLSLVDGCKRGVAPALQRNERLSPSKDANHMRNQSINQSQQQQTTRNSKMLSTGQQQQQQQLSANGKTNTNFAAGLGELAPGLAKMKLNDNLAFSSLRIPRKSSSGASLNSTFVLDHQAANRRRAMGTQDGRGKIGPNSSLPMKPRGATGGAGKTSGAPPDNTSDNNNNPSVWFKYGCI